MKTGHKKGKMLLLSTAMVFFVTAMTVGMAAAQGGYGMMQGGGVMGPCMMQAGMGGMMGPGMMRGGMMGPAMMGANARLTPEERQKVVQANADFWKKTEDLRGDIYRKRLEMQIEMSKKSPDEAAVMKIEDELLALQGKLARMRVTHQLALKAINPRLGRMGWGRMQGSMMHQGMGRHHGMMGGQSMGMGRGPGMMGGGKAPVPAPSTGTTSPADGTGSGTLPQ